ncbi:MAG TPA: hypothetical protein VFR37_08485, partial [Longimicrobium sp.]|nr:hypothetical protein [Longimicrobium sp.]
AKRAAEVKTTGRAVPLSHLLIQSAADVAADLAVVRYAEQHAPQLLAALIEVREGLEASARAHECAGWQCAVCTPCRWMDLLDNALPHPAIV